MTLLRNSFVTLFQDVIFVLFCDWQNPVFFRCRISVNFYFSRSEACFILEFRRFSPLFYNSLTWCHLQSQLHWNLHFPKTKKKVNYGIIITQGQTPNSDTDSKLSWNVPSYMWNEKINDFRRFRVEPLASHFDNCLESIMVLQFWCLTGKLTVQFLAKSSHGKFHRST